MPEPDLFRIFTDRLNRCDITYMITGSVAGIIYGEPRLTHDVDLVLELSAKQIKSMLEEFTGKDFYVPPVEVIRVEIARRTRGHFNIIHHMSGFKADVYLASDALHTWAMGARQHIQLDDSSIWLAPPEYVIIRKLQYYLEGGSAKHTSDIRAILANTNVDLALVGKKAKEIGVAEVWDEIRK